ncbi:lipid-A-disaccharide synthase [Ramlibacter sp. H39-3-26]|uniref:lipid-A-disaccharide synthase n=1 Tax=Curvibacter soli TaxID=3031331 RepID=UPI0023DBC7ED|nr:lipid-A-disaccharide synthase [Ramlibacter sp. H39-3-26]MDF1484012.1 lipid-A-disaccharide synthase [Ramlibacter sp. H39-3-26]
MVAGEASGDLLAGLLLDGLRTRWPGLRAAGIGGPQMARRGFDAWWPSDLLAVHGYSMDVLLRLRALLRIRAQLRERLLRERPAAFIGVDAPDFNFGLEAALRAGGVKTVHFVCPSIWAWRPGRVDTIRASADHVLCLFPFEPALLARHGIAATYVGHPLASVIPLQPDRAGARARLGLGADDTVVALLPGSRRAEIAHLASCFFSAAALMQKAHPAIKFIVPAVPALRGMVEQAAARAGLGDALRILDGQSHAALEACDATLIASGTATLEAALYKRPMVIAYRMGGLSWRLMRRKQLQPWVGLPNILSGEFVVPELLQDAATPAALARATLDWLDAPAKTRALEHRFAALHAELRRDTATLATDAIQKVLEG